MAYIIVVVYRCVCSRNYPEWRASWFNEKSDESGEEQVLLEAIPVVLDGHHQDIECLSTDGTNIVSTCLGKENNNTFYCQAMLETKSVI